MMTAKQKLLLPVYAAALLGISLPESSSGQQSGAPGGVSGQSRYIRLHPMGDQPKSMQTSIVRFQSGKHQGVSIDLISAVHIGEASYYETLNQLFTDYDAVLYELVAEQGTRVPKGGTQSRGMNPLSLMQTSAQRFLGLESQLQKIDYTPKNFVHADLSPDDLKKKMEQRGDTTWSLAMSAFSEVMNNPDVRKQLESGSGATSFSDLSEMLTNPAKAKRFMATQLNSLGNLETGLGSKVTLLIIDDRNQAAMKVLDESLKSGKKKLALFYGAAHMPDFQERLAERGFQPVASSWVTAWDLTKPDQNVKNDTADRAMSLLMDVLKNAGK